MRRRRIRRRSIFRKFPGILSKDFSSNFSQNFAINSFRYSTKNSLQVFFFINSIWITFKKKSWGFLRLLLKKPVSIFSGIQLLIFFRNSSSDSFCHFFNDSFRNFIGFLHHFKGISRNFTKEFLQNASHGFSKKCLLKFLWKSPSDFCLEILPSVYGFF